jgi:hypothetical protein
MQDAPQDFPLLHFFLFNLGKLRPPSLAIWPLFAVLISASVFPRDAIEFKVFML